MLLAIDRNIFEAMVAHLKSVYPLEGCGLLAGKNDRIMQYYPIENRLQSPVAYEMAADQLIAAFMNFEAQGQRLIAICHSHPGGPAFPSATDIGQANYPEAVQIIVSFEELEQPEVGVFSIDDGGITPVTLRVV